MATTNQRTTDDTVEKAAIWSVSGYVALLTAPAIADLTWPVSERILQAYYDPEMLEPGMIVHYVAVSALTFLGAKRSVALLIAAATAAASRMSWRMGFLG